MLYCSEFSVVDCEVYVDIIGQPQRLGTNENLSATADDPDEHVYGGRVDAITLIGQEFSFTIVGDGVMFNGRFSDGTISGTFYQNGFTVPLKLLRSD